MAKYDFLIVGAGFFGATCARKFTDAGYKCLIIEKENFVGGLSATEKINDIMVHKFGSHHLHTNDKEVWDFLSKYGNIIPVNKYVKCLNGNRYYSFPPNMNLLAEVSGEKYPDNVRKYIENDRIKYGVEYRRNFEEDMIYKFGFTPYMLTMKGYYEKLFNCDAKDLSVAVGQDFDMTYMYDENFYHDKYVGIPSEGYTSMVESIIGDDIDILLGKDITAAKDKYMTLANVVICTCPIDKFANYVYGPLPWATLDFELKDYSKMTSNYLGISNVIINDNKNLTIEMIEHKNLVPTKTSKTYITLVNQKKQWTPDDLCLYAINNDKSEELMYKYINFINENYPNVIFGGRQGLYRNISICETVRLALDFSNDLLKSNEQS